MRRRPRLWDAAGDDDPLAGLVNLFDVWMVFSIALLMAWIGAARTRERAAENAPAGALTESQRSVDALLDKQQKLPSYRVSEETLTGKGERLGTAYRLQSGEVVYVPD